MIPDREAELRMLADQDTETGLIARELLAEYDDLIMQHAIVMGLMRERQDSVEEQNEALDGLVRRFAAAAVALRYAAEDIGALTRDDGIDSIVNSYLERAETVRPQT